eukprot:CAMPEP_0114341776 /NCGR_PEP_ID=MMETSP0101-20121206/9273_1 /TAXON_ID=38822 ORGANISM="Pteridomonas danica, Strain PT" /NCGR_SAMPLE_ID=MMETSP0101 /ASSEMBLY_ACC=CAM_ASM_000211 /LENGTH=177 /DNA_ID=CAMNT_0001475493 /DNA_START=71 /DNA_END=604 /DNA_ORIENTATION=-
MYSKILVALAFISSAAANIQFSREVLAIGPDGTVDIELDTSPPTGACATEDAYGSNDCTFDWGQNVTGSFVGTIGDPIESGSTLSVNLKVDKVITWAFSCAACGAVCETTVPVVNQPVSIPLPDCPLPVGSLEKAFNEALPASSPLGGVKVTATGTLGVTNPSGADVLKLSIDISVQ